MADLQSKVIAIALVTLLLDGCAVSKPPRVKCSGTLERINASAPTMDKTDGTLSDAEGDAP
jgi:hypothetical protein